MVYVHKMINIGNLLDISTDLSLGNKMDQTNIQSANKSTPI